MLKLSRFSLFIDSTEGVGEKFDKDSKRIFLYSITLLHLSEEKGNAILIPLAEALMCSHYKDDIKRFFLQIKIFCKKKNITYPLCKHVVLDGSWALINSAVQIFNEEIPNIIIYLEQYFKILNEGLPKLKFVIVQICYCHLIRIVKKDIELHAKNDQQSKIFITLLRKAIKISSLDEMWQWFEALCIILLSSTKENADLALHNIKEIVLEKISSYPRLVTRANYIRSPLYQQPLKIFTAVKTKMDNIINDE